MGDRAIGDKPDYQKAIEALSRGMAIHGDSAPLIQEALAELVQIMRGNYGPYARSRMQAITRLLDTFSGKPREAPKPSRGDPRGAIDKLVDGCEDD